MKRAYAYTHMGSGLERSWFMLKRSWSIVSYHSDIIKPTHRMIVLSLIIRSSVFFCIYEVLSLGANMVPAVLYLLFCFFILTPFKYFYDMRQHANQILMVYQTLKHRKLSYREAKQQSGAFAWRIRALAVLDFLFKFSRGGERRGLVASMFFGFLFEVWDLAAHFILPVVVIDDKSLKEAAVVIKDLRNHVPEALVGVFGIDFIGDVLRLLTGPLYVILMLIGAVLGFYFGVDMPVHTQAFVAGQTVSWLPAFVLTALMAILNAFIIAYVDMIKNVYFTFFYASINHRDDISDKMRDDIENYLLQANK